MKNIPKIITISELSRLTNLSRPTLYKYLEAYDSKCFDNIPNQYVDLFNFIEEKAYCKDEIYHYCIAEYNSNNREGLLAKTQVLLKNEEFSKLLRFLVDNSCDLDFEKIYKEMEKNYYDRTRSNEN